MNCHRMHLIHRNVLTVSATSVLLVAISGCGADGQEPKYVIPSTLCGININSSEFTPFLPGGRKIAIREKSSSTLKRCEVVVDKNVIATTSREWMGAGRTTSYFAALQTLDTLQGSAEGGRYLYSGNEAFGKTSTCVGTQHKQELYTAVQARGSEHEDANAMKRFIISFTKEVGKSNECTAGVQE